MKHYIFCAIVSLVFWACNSIEPKPDNQPIDPQNWSPVGKTYVCDRSSDNPYDAAEYWEVIKFTNNAIATYYGTTHKDLTPIDRSFDMPVQEARYELSYPALTLDFGGIVSHLVFADTITIHWATSELTFTLH